MKILQHKPFLISTLLLFVVMHLSLSGQVTITNDDMPSPGDTVRKSNAISTAGIDYTITGENHQWDFTQLQPLFQSVDTFVSVTSVPFLYQLVFIPNFVANIAQKFPEIDTLGIPISDPYRFFKNTNASFTDVGFAVTVTDIPLPLKFDDADVIYDFPVEYGNVDSSFSGVGFGIPDLGYISIDRKRVNEVDGWGTLNTSYGTFDVLRVKSTVTEKDSIYIDSIGFGQALNRFYTEYKWLSPGYPEPMLQVTEEGPLLTVAWMDSVFNPPTSVPEEMTTELSMKIFPNPVMVSGEISIKNPVSGEARISVFDLTGRQIQVLYSGFLISGKHKISLDAVLLELNNGIYFIRMESAAGIVTKKLLIR
jgi:hypothetical protein